MLPELTADFQLQLLGESLPALALGSRLGCFVLCFCYGTKHSTWDGDGDRTAVRGLGGKNLCFSRTSHLPRQTLCLSNMNSPPLLPFPGNHLLLSVPIIWTTLGTSHKRSHLVVVLLILVYFTQQGVLQAHPCCSLSVSSLFKAE